MIQNSQEKIKKNCKVTSKQCLAESTEKPPPKSRILPGVMKARRSIMFNDVDRSQKLIERLNKYGICLVSGRKYEIMDKIGKHHLEKAIELVKEKKSFVIVLDNIDWTQKVYDAQKENQNKSVHAVSSCLVFDCVSSSHLPDNLPQISNDEEKTKLAIQLTEEEITETTRRYQTFVARILLGVFSLSKAFWKVY
ncbi:Hypothetical predicted protein [Paramuricea clavata]|uniref:Uncharacterized protein n=1 Tax=Paramuricea clavata TaxID=317549 RepID=A0A7D9LEQ1_PARCT|nr:Hypothetical predicted protein [Paramuricea clavata]